MMLDKAKAFFLSIILILLSVKTYSQTSLYAIASPSHFILKDKYFLPSIKDNYKIIVKEVEQVSPTGGYRSEGFQSAVTKKVDLIIHAIKECFGSYFIYSDVDIQFIKPIDPTIKRLLQGNDILIQRATRHGGICTGFMVIRANRRTLRFWKKVKHNLINKKNTDDQQEFNLVLHGSKNIKCKILPRQFYSPEKMWQPGDILILPDNILLHHANWTIGINNKIKQLEYVKRLLKKKR